MSRTIRRVRREVSHGIRRVRREVSHGIRRVRNEVRNAIRDPLIMGAVAGLATGGLGMAAGLGATAATTAGAAAATAANQTLSSKEASKEAEKIENQRRVEIAKAAHNQDLEEQWAKEQSQNSANINETQTLKEKKIVEGNSMNNYNFSKALNKDKEEEDLLKKMLRGR